MMEDHLSIVHVMEINFQFSFLSDSPMGNCHRENVLNVRFHGTTDVRTYILCHCG